MNKRMRGVEKSVFGILIELVLGCRRVRIKYMQDLFII
jgi:hypothetical protein